MKKAYIVKLVNAALGTETKVEIFLDKYKARDYYLKLREEVKYDELTENTNNIFGDIARDDCCLVTTLSRDDRDTHRIVLIGYDLIA